MPKKESRITVPLKNKVKDGLDAMADDNKRNRARQAEAIIEKEVMLAKPEMFSNQSPS